MINLSKEEVAKLAKISGMEISSAEQEQLCKDLTVFLSYAQQIIDVKITNALEANKNVNVFRDDKVFKQHDINVENVFEHRHNDYLVVPKVLD